MRRRAGGPSIRGHPRRGRCRRHRRYGCRSSSKSGQVPEFGGGIEDSPDAATGVRLVGGFVGEEEGPEVEEHLELQLVAHEVQLEACRLDHVLSSVRGLEGTDIAGFERIEDLLPCSHGAPGVRSSRTALPDSSTVVPGIPILSRTYPRARSTMSMTNSEKASGDRANELYWGSDRSVNDLAEDLNLSKGALYSLIEPLPADLDCPECGGEMQYANRTARDRGIVTCAECELEEEETLVRIESGDDSVLSGSSGFG